MKKRIDAQKTTQKPAAGKKNGSSTPQNQTAEIIDCATGYPIEIGDDDEIPNLIMFVPAGTSRIQPMINGAPAPEEIELSVDSSVLETLQRDLEQRWTKNVRPIGDFDHKPGPASFIPKRFEWRDGEGLFLEVDWTASGEKAVRGKDYSYFSPSFKMAEGKIVGLPEKGAIGALTNSPAFREIKRIAASEPPEPQPGHQANTNQMNQILTQCVTLGLVTETSDEVRATTQLVTSITALNKRVEAAEAQVAEYKKKEETARKDSAEAAIEAAIREGRLPGKNERIKTFWVNSMLADPEGTKATLESIKPDPVLTQTFKVTAGDATGHRVINGISVQEQLQIKLAAIRAANRDLSLEDCYVMLEAQNPELVAAAQVEISPPQR
jgi:Mu-like prophage I protein